MLNRKRIKELWLRPPEEPQSELERRLDQTDELWHGDLEPVDEVLANG
jgi:hypothetical protein